ncbi:MAG: GNAT family N-acetyltransferase [Candidatus Kariarchaeaceae archaeon]
MFKSKKVFLRSFELSDISEMMKYINDYSVKRALGDPFPTSSFEQEEWIKKTWKQRREGSNYYFAIELLETKKIVGVTGLKRVNTINRSASFTVAIYNRFLKPN